MPHFQWTRRRIGVLTIAAIMIAPFLAGCGQSSTPVKQSAVAPSPPTYHAELSGVSQDGNHLVSGSPANVSFWISSTAEARPGLGNWPVNPTLLEEKGAVPLKVHLRCSVCPDRPFEQPLTYDAGAQQSTRANFVITADRRLADADGNGTLTFIVFRGGQLLDRLDAPIQVDAVATARATGRAALSSIQARMAPPPDSANDVDIIVAVGMHKDRVHVGVTAASDFARKALSAGTNSTFIERQLPDGPRFGEIKAPIEHAFDGLKELIEKDPSHRPVLSALQTQGPFYSSNVGTQMTSGEYDGTVAVLARLGTPLYDRLFRCPLDGRSEYRFRQASSRFRGTSCAVSAHARSTTSGDLSTSCPL